MIILFDIKQDFLYTGGALMFVLRKQVLVTLKELLPGQRGVIESLGKQSTLRKRIIDMGLTIGTEIKVIKRAPLGDPIEIKVRGYQLSLRQHEAHEIFVRVLSD